MVAYQLKKYDPVTKTTTEWIETNVNIMEKLDKHTTSQIELFIREAKSSPKPTFTLTEEVQNLMLITTDEKAWQTRAYNEYGIHWQDVLQFSREQGKEINKKLLEEIFKIYYEEIDNGNDTSLLLADATRTVSIPANSFIEVKRIANKDTQTRGLLRLHNISNLMICLSLDKISIQNKKLPQGMSPGFGIGDVVLKEGDMVKAKHPTYNQYLRGVIAVVHQNNTYDIKFNDLSVKDGACNDSSVQDNDGNIFCNILRKHMSRGDLEIQVLIPLATLQELVPEQPKVSGVRYVIATDYAKLCDKTLRFNMNELLEMILPVKDDSSCNPKNRFLGYQGHHWEEVVDHRIRSGLVKAPLLLRLWNATTKNVGNANQKEDCVIGSDAEGNNNYSLKSGEEALVFPNAGGKDTNILVVIPSNSISRTPEERQVILTEMDDALVKYICAIRSSGMVSLMQKIIRLQIFKNQKETSLLLLINFSK